MPSSLILLTGPPLPGRWSLARALEQRCGARRFSADAGSAPLDDIARALAGNGCVLVEGDLPTRQSRREILALGGDERLLIEWHCGQKEAEREAFHRYASRPRVLGSAELARYLDDAAVREPVGGELPEERVVRVGPELAIDAQVARALGALCQVPAPGPPKSERRVMVIEDDADERALLAEVLEELGFAVEVAPDAGVALALLDEGVQVELLISDQQMPGMSGVELAREVARRWPGLRTVLLTAFSDEDMCRRAVEASAVTVLAKPLSVNDLQRVLEETEA